MRIKFDESNSGAAQLYSITRVFYQASDHIQTAHALGAANMHGIACFA